MRTKQFLGFFLSLLIIKLPVCIAETLSLTYDRNGNLVTGDGFYREYNSLNQLWRVRNGSTISDPVLEEYKFHPMEERILIKKRYNSTGNLIETVYYVNENHIRVVNSSGTYDTIYVRHEGQLIAELRNDSTKIFHHPDHLGSATLVTDESGNELERDSYTPYGLLLGGGTQSRYGYEGKEHKEGSGSVPKGELAYFDFDGIVEDNGYNSTIYEAIKATGNIGYGYYFDGIDDYIDFGTHMDIDSEDSFTYAAWVYTDGLSKRGVVFGGDYLVRDCFSLETDGTIRLRLDDSHITSDGKIMFGEWNHVVAVYTYDSGNGGKDTTVALYINGVLDKEDNPIWDGAVFDSWTSGQRRAGYDGDVDYFKGIVDELGVWKRALSAEEVEELYSFGPSENREVDFDSRMYNTDWGIFVNPDSLTANAFDPQLLNAFAFVRNNPYKYIDPAGKEITFANKQVGGDIITMVFASNQYVGRIVKEYSTVHTYNINGIEFSTSTYEYDVQPGSIYNYKGGTQTIDMYDDPDASIRKLGDIYYEDRRNPFRSDNFDMAAAILQDALTVFGLGKITGTVKGSGYLYKGLGIVSDAASTGTIAQAFNNPRNIIGLFPGGSTYLEVTRVRYTPSNKVEIYTNTATGRGQLKWFKNERGNIQYKATGSGSLSSNTAAKSIKSRFS